jgi:uncharacterized RDD family membrane protein YckC
MPVDSPIIQKTHQTFSSKNYTRRVGPTLAVLLLCISLFIIIWLFLGPKPFEPISSPLITVLLYLLCYSPAWLTLLLAIQRYFRRRKYVEQAQVVENPALVVPEQVNQFIKTRGAHGHFAGIASRFIALMIDLSIIGLTSILATVFLHIAEPVLGLINLVSYLIDTLGIDPRVVTMIKITANTVFFFGYFVVQWSLFGKTVGKALMGLRVVTRNGKPPAPWQSVLRVFGYLLSSLTLLVGFLWAGIDRQRQAWHDILAGTFVIYDWDAMPDGWFLNQAIKKRQSKLEKKSQQGTISE